ncbi:MAG: hypothetical protein M3R63_13305 [Actinomycetota bacterium]|nr:hypothetical protein [Actinomycetota bacterium]
MTLAEIPQCFAQRNSLPRGRGGWHIVDIGCVICIELFGVSRGGGLSVVGDVTCLVGVGGVGEGVLVGDAGE